MVNKRRQYLRKCGHCGRQYEQSDMHRTGSGIAANGWLCDECFQYVEARNADYYFDEEF